MSRRGTGRARLFPGDPADPHGFHRACVDFLDWIEVRHYSPRTVSGFRDSLAIFVVWCETRGVTRPVEVTRPVLEAYQRHLFWRRKRDGAPLSNQTQYTRLVPIRGLFRYLVRQNRVLANPASDLELPKVDQRLPRAVLTVSETERVLALPDVRSPFGLRDRAILEVLYSTGIRRQELIALTVWDLDPERGLLTVRKGKGRKDRVVPAGERAAAWVARYASDARPRLVVPPDVGVLFLTKEGLDFTPDHLSGLVTRYVERADLGKRGSCHLFRHTMATLMLEGGADIRYIQAMLGHAELGSTQLYTQVAVGTLKAVHAACHPGAAFEPRRRSPDHPSLGNTGQADEDDVAGLLDALDAEDEEAPRPDLNPSPATHTSTRPTGPNPPLPNRPN